MYQECSSGQFKCWPLESWRFWTKQAHQGSEFSWCVQNDWGDWELWVSRVKLFIYVNMILLCLFFFCFLNKTKDRYMAPEVFKHRKYDKKVDVFSFAMILYEVIELCLWWWDVMHLKFSPNALLFDFEQMLEGEPPLANYEPYDAAKYVAEGHRPFFRAKGFTPELRE